MMACFGPTVSSEGSTGVSRGFAGSEGFVFVGSSSTVGFGGGFVGAGAITCSSVSDSESSYATRPAIE